MSKTTLDRVRTEHCFGKVYGQIDKVIAACTGSHVLIADENTWGHVQFYTACKKSGKVPLLGVTIAVVDDVFTNKNKEPDMWVTVVPINDEGLRGLYQLVRTSHQFFYYQPRVGLDDIISSKNWRVIVRNSPMMQKLKGKKNVWVGVSPSDYRYSAPAAVKVGLPQIAISDNCYPRPEHKNAYEIFVRFADSRTSPMYILTPEEMRKAMPDVKAPAFEVAWEAFVKGIDVHLPKAENIHIDSKKTLKQYCVEGAKRKGIDLKDKVYAARLKRELDMIAHKQFEDYFYLVNDIIAAAKQVMLVGPGRGSSAGSLVCYLMDITEVDPIPHGLLFERFIDITRADLPDIDIDFPDRDWVFRYLQDKYGEEKVAHIGTVLSYKAKSAISDVGKALHIPEWELKAVKDAVIERSGGDQRAAFCLKDTFESLDVGKALLEKYPAMAIAAELEEHAKSSGVHAAGVIICNEPVSNYCGVTGEGVACIDKKDAEKINILKVDVLGLRTLIVLQDVLEQIGEDNDLLYNLHDDDEPAFEVLTQGKLAGIFQFEGYALKNLTSQMGVHNFEDIVSITSLARPGPLHNGSASEFVKRRIGQEEVTYIHPMLEPYLKETLGTMVYQEQIMAIVKHIGLFSWEDTTDIRKAMSKTMGEEYFNKYIEKFVIGAKTHGINKEDALNIWKNMSTHGSWSFNRCLAGTTKLMIASKGNNMKGDVDIATLYEMYHGIDASPWCKDRAKKGKIAQIWSLDGDKFKIHNVKSVHKNGTKSCNRYLFDDGSFVDCTADHKFIINGKWQRAGKAKIGSVWLAGKLDISKKVSTKDNSARGRHWNIVDGDRTGEANPSYKNGATVASENFKNAHQADPCEDCGCDHNRMEAHHNDFKHGADEPTDLAWLCPSCHKKRHYANGRTKRGGKGLMCVGKILNDVCSIGDIATYDLEMVSEPHNFTIDNGLVTHNSHGVSYGLISYWCAYLKAHHPLEFAAATLRNLKDADQAIKMLRELVKEGFEYIPFDPKLSKLNWSVQDGKLVGGWLGVKGVGEKKASTMIAKLEMGSKLTPSEQKLMECPEIAWQDIFAGERLFGHIYKDYEGNGLSMPVSYINDVQADGEYIVIGQIKELNQRDANEYGSVIKRGGRIVKHNALWLNLRIEDDTGEILVTIPRASYNEMGKPIVESGAIGHWYMFRGKLSGGWRKLTVEKTRRMA
jgi:hypothetical protein